MNPFCPELTVWRPSCFHLPLPFEPRQSTALGLYSLRKGSTRYSCTSLQKLTARVIRLAHIAISFGATDSFRLYCARSVLIIPFIALFYIRLARLYLAVVVDPRMTSSVSK